MRNHTSQPSREIIAEASAWLIEFRTEDPGQAERDRFNAWLRTSPQHIQAYLEVAAAWSELPDADPEGRIDIAKMIAAARQSSDANITSFPHAKPAYQPASRSLNPGARTWYAVATALLVFLASAYLYTQRGVYDTEIGEQRSLTLADGSSVELNSRSTIRVRYSERERRIQLLKGQALFRVAKNNARPFVVDTGTSLVRAVGTQFDVYRKTSETIVTVVEGKVAITSPSAPASQLSRLSERSAQQPSVSDDRESRDAGIAPVFLTAGEQLTMPADISTAIQGPQPADIEAATAWTHKRLVFEDTPLVDVAEEFNRYNTRRLVIADPELQRVGVSGLYSSTDPTSLIAFLRTQPTILVTESETEIRITRKAN